MNDITQINVPKSVIDTLAGYLDDGMAITVIDIPTNFDGNIGELIEKQAFQFYNQETNIEVSDVKITALDSESMANLIQLLKDVITFTESSLYIYTATVLQKYLDADLEVELKPFFLFQLNK